MYSIRTLRSRSTFNRHESDRFLLGTSAANVWSNINPSRGTGRVPGSVDMQQVWAIRQPTFAFSIKGHGVPLQWALQVPPVGTTAYNHANSDGPTGITEGKFKGGYAPCVCLCVCVHAAFRVAWKHNGLGGGLISCVVKDTFTDRTCSLV